MEVGDSTLVAVLHTVLVSLAGGCYPRYPGLQVQSPYLFCECPCVPPASGDSVWCEGQDGSQAEQEH